MATKKPAAKKAAPAKPRKAEAKPASKPAQRPSKPKPSALDEFVAKPLPTGEGEVPLLRETGTPGVYLNRMNILVDAKGVALAFKDVVRKDQEALSEVLDGTITSPATFLKSVSMDPRRHISLRIDAAKAAAPYFDRKMPQAIDGGQNPDGTPIPLFDPSKIQGLSTKELLALKDLLKKAGAAT